MNLTEFLKRQPQITNTFLPKGVKLDKIDFKMLSDEIDNSRKLLKRYNCIGWILKNYERIIRGDFRDVVAIYNIGISYAAPKFGAERNYTKEELDGLIDDISTINLSGD